VSAAIQRPARGQGGFTLLELLITMAVTVIGLMGLMSLHLTTTRGNDIAGRSGEGVTIAQQTLEDLRARGYKDMVEALTGNRSSALPIDVVLNVVQGRNGMSYRRRAIVQEMTSASTGLVRVRLEVSWTDDGAAQGSDNGVHDHIVALEVIRTRLEAM
jgi:prepilin-type N-terminal cleavage/methylation domain-containing protein